MIALPGPFVLKKLGMRSALRCGSKHSRSSLIIGSGELETSSLGSCILHILVLDDSVAANLDVS
jgi:hypothetical protein